MPVEIKDIVENNKKAVKDKVIQVLLALKFQLGLLGMIVQGLKNRNLQSSTEAYCWCAYTT